jgi:cytochrome c oxidase assembly protein subunit 15
VHVWVEYLNRLTAMPVGMLTLAVFVMSFRFRKSRPRVWWGSGAALFLVLFNAWLGMKVVKSGLTPGVITLHMAAAMLMLCVLVSVVFSGGDDEGRFVLLKPDRRKLVRGLLIALFVLTVSEGVMGSQVREKTDALAHGHANQPRSEWIGELEESWIYLVHRSFSWALVALAAVFFFKARGAVAGSVGRAPGIIFGLMLGQMLLGVLLAFAGVPPAVQVLHVGISALLVATEFYFLLATRLPRGDGLLATTR